MRGEKAPVAPVAGGAWRRCAGLRGSPSSLCVVFGCGREVPVVPGPVVMPAVRRVHGFREVPVVPGPVVMPAVRRVHDFREVPIVPGPVVMLCRPPCA